MRTGLRAILDGHADLDVVGAAATGTEAISLASRLRPDVVLMDLRMPHGDGVSAIAAIRERQPDTRVLVLTTYETDADILRAIEAGATGYLLKDATSDELICAIRATAAGEAVLSAPVASRLTRRIRDTGEEALTSREIEILEHVAQGRSNREIGTDLFISEATVKTHLLHILAKLAVQDRTEAVTVALQRGILRLEPRER